MIPLFPFSHIYCFKGVDVVRRFCCGSQGQGSELVAAAAALTAVMAQGKTAEELELLAVLFQIIGNNLGLLALKAPSADDCCPKQEENQSRCT